jgi:CTP synthase
MASQFHPEFRSRPTRAHPLFREFVAAAAERARERADAAAAVAAPADLEAAVEEPTPQVEHLG